MKNGEECSRNWSRKRHGSASASIFLLFSPSFHQFQSNLLTKGVEPLSLSPPRLFIGKMGEEVAAQLARWLTPEATCLPRWAGCFSPKSCNGPRWAQGLRNAPKLTILPPFWVFCSFPSETSQNRMDCALTGVKQLNLVGEDPHVGKQLSSNKIMVWHPCCWKEEWLCCCNTLVLVNKHSHQESSLVVYFLLLLFLPYC